MSGQINYYLRDNNTGSYRLLAASPGFNEAQFADSALGGSRILFEDSEQLLHNAAPGVINLYEWDEGNLSVAGILPGGEVPAGGTIAGTGAISNHYTEHTISDDGSRVFFTDNTTGRLYVRENGETTLPVSVEAGHFREATPSGRYVFYTDKSGELWRFDVNTDTREPLAGAVGGAMGVIGVSDDGTYAYFVNGATDLYQWHEGGSTPTLVFGPLDGPGVAGAPGDEDDWRDKPGNGGEGPSGRRLKSAQVSSDGKTVLFFHGAALFMYNATTAAVSRLAEGARFGLKELQATFFLRNAFTINHLSADGTRAFFESERALLPRDTNGVMDVYEWERDGAGSCDRTSDAFREDSGGCIYLLSSGQSATPSYYGAASADGNDVFFFTRQSLVGEDRDSNVDLYDAHVDGGIASQNQLTSPECLGEGCMGTTASPPSLSIPASNTLSGTGNLMSPVLGSPARLKVKPPTAAQRLIATLNGCHKKPTKTRRRCELKAHKEYRAAHTKRGRLSSHAHAHSLARGSHS
jgi:hypothetical protein